MSKVNISVRDFLSLYNGTFLYDKVKICCNETDDEDLLYFNAIEAVPEELLNRKVNSFFVMTCCLDAPFLIIVVKQNPEEWFSKLSEEEKNNVMNKYCK